MMQQMMYPPVVTVSDDKFRSVITNTTSAMTHISMNAYMWDMRVVAAYSSCADNVSSTLDANV
jgi:hypothetical protein